MLGVVKAYTTRVGSGPLAHRLLAGDGRRSSGPWAASTAPPRAAPAGADGSTPSWPATPPRVNGLTGLAVTKLDVLDTLPELSIATAYRTPDGVTEEFPPDTSVLGDVEPVYETLPGWESPTSEVRTVQDLPPRARAYLDRIEAVTGTPIDMISVGTRRQQIIRIR